MVFSGTTNYDFILPRKQGGNQLPISGESKMTVAEQELQTSGISTKGINKTLLVFENFFMENAHRAQTM